MNRNLLIIIFTGFIGLVDGNGITNRPSSRKIPVFHSKYNPASNITQIKQYGDSVRLEIEKQGNFVITHVIDLKGVKDDGFDDSYTVTSTYTEMPTDTTLRSNFYIPLGDYALYFDKHTLLSYCDSMVNSNTDKKYYKDLRKYINGVSDMMYLGFEVGLIQQFKCRVVNRKSRQTQKALLIESYTTDFSGGKTYYVVSKNNDTNAIFHMIEYIK